MTKVCFKCGLEKDISEFYRHSGMTDGYLGKCKECTRSDVRRNYRKNRDHYVDYDRLRSQDPERKKKALEYQRIRRYKNKVKYLARNMVNNAIRDGRIEKQPCAVCGSLLVEAHHEDYLDPLNVVWLCRKHHLERHGKIFDRKR